MNEGSVRYLSRTLLKNVLHHTETHNRLLEEGIMWKQKRAEDRKGEEEVFVDGRWQNRKKKRSRSRSSERNVPYGHMRSDGCGAGPSNREDVNRKILKKKEKEPDRWGHTGFQQMYPDEFLCKSSMDEMSDSDLDKPKKSKKKSKKHKKKKKRRSEKSPDSKQGFDLRDVLNKRKLSSSLSPESVEPLKQPSFEFEEPYGPPPPPFHHPSSRFEEPFPPLPGPPLFHQRNSHFKEHHGPSPDFSLGPPLFRQCNSQFEECHGPPPDFSPGPPLLRQRNSHFEECHGLPPDLERHYKGKKFRRKHLPGHTQEGKKNLTREYQDKWQASGKFVNFSGQEVTKEGKFVSLAPSTSHEEKKTEDLASPKMDLKKEYGEKWKRTGTFLASRSKEEIDPEKWEEQFESKRSKKSRKRDRKRLQNLAHEYKKMWQPSGHYANVDEDDLEEGEVPELVVKSPDGK